MTKIFRAESIADVQLAIRSSSQIRIAGNGSKSISYQTACDSSTLDITPLSGIIDYDPSEFTVTARAGTRLEDLTAALAERGQFLPFDPPLVQQGATVGGMIAAGLSGPNRLRFGSVRDFILGIRFVDGTGAVASAGGKVVKNAAGFDIPKLFVGSWGELGAILEVTLKVFPRPVEYCSVRIETDSISDAIEIMHRLARSPLDLDAIDLNESRALLVRLGGKPNAIEQGAARVITRSERKGTCIMPSPAERQLWSPLQDWSWCGADEMMIRIPLTTFHIQGLESKLESMKARRRFSVGGNVAYIACPTTAELIELDRILHLLRLPGRIIRGGPVQSSQIGQVQSDAFSSRIRHAMDPENRFARRA